MLKGRAQLTLRLVLRRMKLPLASQVLPMASQFINNAMPKLVWKKLCLIINLSPQNEQLPLSLYEVQIDYACKTGALSKRLTPFLNEIQRQKVTVAALDRARKAGRTPIEVKTASGVWIAQPAGMSSRFYLWNLYFRPNNQVEKEV